MKVFTLFDLGIRIYCKNISYVEYELDGEQLQLCGCLETSCTET